MIELLLPDRNVTFVYLFTLCMLPCGLGVTWLILWEVRLRKRWLGSFRTPSTHVGLFLLRNFLLFSSKRKKKEFLKRVIALQPMEKLAGRNVPWTDKSCCLEVFPYIYNKYSLFTSYFYMFPVLISVITLLFVPLRNLKIAVMLHTKYYTGKESSSLLLLVFHQTEFFKLIHEYYSMPKSIISSTNQDAIYECLFQTWRKRWRWDVCLH